MASKPKDKATAFEPRDDTSGRNTPKWQEFYDRALAEYLAQGPDTPEWRPWWYAHAVEKADADYATHKTLLQALTAFQQETVAKMQRAVSDPSPNATPPVGKPLAEYEMVFQHTQAVVLGIKNRRDRGRDKVMSAVRESLEANFSVTNALMRAAHSDQRLDHYVIRRKKSSASPKGGQS